MRSLLLTFLIVVPFSATASDPPSEPRIVVIPLGNPDPAVVEQAARTLEEKLYFKVEVASPVPLPRRAWYAPRKRWRAEILLDYLAAIDVGPAFKVIGVTSAPISTTKGDIKDWGIAGLGTIDGKASVLTTYLFRRVKRKRPKRFARFVANLVLHEMGHTLNLEHCPLARCIMADAKGNAIRAGRLSINEFCPRCHRRLKGRLRALEVQGEWSEVERAQIGDL